LLRREVEKRTGLIDGLAKCFDDHRDPRLIEHAVKALVGRRVCGLCLGYEDLNAHDQLRTDPMLAVALAACSALHPLDLSVQAAQIDSRGMGEVIDESPGSALKLHSAHGVLVPLLRNFP